MGNPATKMFDVSMTNFNNWTFADPSYNQTSEASVMNLGEFDGNYTAANASTMFSPVTIGGHLLPLTMFSFGKTNVTNSSEFYNSILNSDNDTYTTYANTTIMGLNFRGLGLPTDSFKAFTNMLSVVTKGEATCVYKKGGYCALSNPCSVYKSFGLWDYDFKIQFEEDSNYIRVPLASFAADFDEEGGVCVIFVEYLNTINSDSKSIILGNMFFQSIYAQYTFFGVNAV